MTLSGYNSFYHNTAVAYGGAIYVAKVLNIGGGTFYDNKANSGAALYLDTYSVATIAPEENAVLAFNDSYYIGNSTGLLIAGSVAGNLGTIAVELALVTSGKILATGSDYTVTDEDAAVFGVKRNSETTVIVDEESNTLVIGTVSDTDSGDSDSDSEEEEEEEDAAHNLSEVYLNGSTGSDSNDGATSSTAVKTFAMAKSLLAKDGTIYITGVVTVSGSESWSLDEETYGDAKVVRASGYTSGSLITVTGALTLSNITIDGNGITTTGSYSCAVYINGGLITINEGTILSNHSSSGTYSGCIYGASGSAVLMNGGLITGCSCTDNYSAVIYLDTNSSFRMTGGTISGNRSTGTYSGVVTMNSSSTAPGYFAMTGGTISGNTSTGTYSGAVYMSDYGALSLSGGTITENTASSRYSGAITTGTRVTLTISGGEITDNTAANGAVQTGSYCTLNMTGGLISGNISTDRGGGGILVGAYSTANLTGGEISYNVTDSYGGGVAISATATLNVGNVLIIGNSADTFGGGIGVIGAATITVSGATITGNTAAYGGGIYTSTGLVGLTITSGTISGNSATGGRGTGIYIQKTGVVTFAPEESGLEIADQIYVLNTSVASGGKVVLIDDLTNLIGSLNFNFYYLVDGNVVAEPADDYTITESDLARFGCDGCRVAYSLNSDGQIIMSTTAVESVALNKTELTVMATDTDTLTATLNPEGASNLNITWTSSNTSVAKVSGSSLEAVVTGVSAGTATITATTSDGGYTATCTVTVTENTTPIVSITLDQSEAIMVIGDTTALTATITPDNAYSTEITWSTSDDSVVSISGSGSTVTLTAVDNGTATVTATAADGKSASCVITVANVAVTGITLSKSSVTVPEGDIATLGSYTITPGNANNQTVTWTVGDESIAQITVDGTSATVKGISAGTTTVTVTTEDGGYSASCEVTVTEVSNAMTLDITSMDMIIYQSFNLTALFESHVEDVTWSTSDSTVVSILSAEGNQVTVKAGGSEGSVTITATSESGQSATCAITVTGVVAGTLTDVYLDSLYGSDKNSGASSSDPVASWSKAVSLLAVNGTIHIGYRCNITADTVISLPSEVYGNATIEFYKKYGTSNGFYLYGDYNLYISDATIDTTTLTGNLIYMTDSYCTDNIVVLSNNVTVSGGSGRIAYVTGGTLIFNGGTYSDVSRSSAYGAIYINGGTLYINGGTFSDISGGSYGGLIGLYSTAYINGGIFTGITSSGYGGLVSMMSGSTLYLRGGTFSDLKASAGNSHFMNVSSDGLTVDPIYGVSVDSVIYMNSFSFTIASSLERVEGTIGVRLSTLTSGTVIAMGSGYTLNSTDLSKISVNNVNCTAVLNTDKNAIGLACLRFCVKRNQGARSESSRRFRYTPIYRGSLRVTGFFMIFSTRKRGAFFGESVYNDMGREGNPWNGAILP